MLSLFAIYELGNRCSRTLHVSYALVVEYAKRRAPETFFAVPYCC